MTESERLKRWRLVLGSEAEGSCGVGAGGLTGGDIEMDRALSALYRFDNDTRSGGLGRSATNVARWLGDIRTYFPRRDCWVLLRATQPTIHDSGNMIGLVSLLNISIVHVVTDSISILYARSLSLPL